MRRRPANYMDAPSTDEELDRMLTELDATITGTTELTNMKELTLESENYSGHLTLGDYNVEKALLITPALPSTMRHPWAGQKLMWYNFSSVAMYWFGWAFVWMSLLAVILPKQLEFIVGPDEKNQKQGIVLTIGSLFSLVVSPLAGALSDRSHSIYGRRRPYILYGTVFDVIGLCLMATSPPFPIYCIGYIFFSLGNYIMLAPYAALVPDVIPADQRGMASGYLGGFSLLGGLAGGVLSYNLDSIGFVAAYVILILVTIFCGYVTCHFVPEVQSAKRYREFFGCGCCCNMCSAFGASDFRWVFASRFCVQMGIITVQENLQYYLKDTIHPDDYYIKDVQVAQSEVEAVSFLLAPMLLGGVLSSIIAGVLSDLWGMRKGLLYFSGISMAMTCFLFGMNSSFLLDVLLALMFGFGFGVFSAIDWAIATDVLPNSDDFAKDMGVWNLAFTGPQMFSPYIIGFILSTFKLMGHIRVGWFIVFSMTSFFLLLGTYFIKFIEHVK